MGALIDEASAWIWAAAGLVAVIAGMYGAVRWARRQLRDAVVSDIKPLLSEIGLSVNNVQPGEPKLVERLIGVETAATNAATEAGLARSMSEANGAAVKELAAETRRIGDRLDRHLTREEEAKGQ